ncbi:MAG: ATP-binding cassette domain-containing protein, partial [Clostridiales bacterium]|nr:ATP-binding cassette domain-containing protein [Clostridiales bacterium]
MSIPVLNVSEVSKSYFTAGKKIDAVRSVSMTVEEGECVGLVGESGCGKSTLARLITRLERPDSGKIMLCGEDIVGLSGSGLR